MRSRCARVAPPLALAPRGAPLSLSCCLPSASFLPSPCALFPPPQPVKYDKSEQQLNALLMSMVEEDKLDFSNGKFSLKPQ